MGSMATLVATSGSETDTLLSHFFSFQVQGPGCDKEKGACFLPRQNDV